VIAALLSLFQPQKTAEGLKILSPDKTINKGLDLKGGMHVVLGVDTEKAFQNQVQRQVEDLEKYLQQNQVELITLKLDKTDYRKLHLDLVKGENYQKARELIENYKIWEVSREGATKLLLTYSSSVESRIKKEAAEQALEVIRNRIDQFGVSEPQIQKQGANQIVVELPGVADTNRALKIIGKTALLEFKLVESDAKKLERAKEGGVPEGYQLVYLKEKDGTEETLLLHQETVLTGNHLEYAFVSPGNLGQPQVSFKLDRMGGKLFSRITGENIGERLAIMLDNKIQSAPVIKNKIRQEGVITGNYTLEEAHDLALILRAGTLPAPVEVLSLFSVGPTLGEDSVRKGTQAAIIGAILVVLFMVVYYALSGMVANFALFLSLLLVLGTLAGFNATLTLPGIAGLVLTIGMSVDANVLIFERIREESAKGKTVRAAIDSGYRRALLTITDANVTTLIAALVLYYFGSGPIRGFAVVLSVGILASMFSALIVSKLIFDYFVYKRRITTLSI